MKQFTIELDDTIYIWLKHISQLTNEPIEKLITNGLYNQLAKTEDDLIKLFTYNE